MKVKIPEALAIKLRNKTKAGDEPVSAVVRRALARELEVDTVDFSKLATPYLGIFSGPAVSPLAKAMVSEIHRNTKIIATDRRDFSIYRRFGRHRLPVILPPA